MSAKTIRNGNRAKQSALDRCRFAVFSSDWAAKTTIEHYMVDPEKVKVIPHGANMKNGHHHEINAYLTETY